MPQFNQGDIVRDYFTVVDANNNRVSGVTFVTGAVEDPDGGSFTLDISEIGSGVYKVEFLASKVGTYYWRVDSTNLSPNQSFEESFVIGPINLYGAAIGTASYGSTLNELIEAVATRNGDFLRLVATEPGSLDGTSFVDSLHLSGIPSQALNGASLTVTAPEDSLNYLRETRVTDFDEDTSVLTLQPALPMQALANDEAQVTNLYSRGAWRRQYIDAINLAIDAAHPSHLINLEYVYPDVWNQDDPTIPLPTHVTHVYGIRVNDGVNQPWLVPASDQNIPTIPGWYYDFSVGRLGLSGQWNTQAHAGAVTILGYGRAARLVNGDDRTTVDPEWISLYATNIMKLGKGDQKLLAPASMFGNNADIIRAKIITGLHPNTIQVR